MRLYVYSRGAIERLPPPKEAYAVISITSALGDQARLPASPHCVDVLRLSFPDLDAASPAFPEEALFSSAQAEQVWAFVLSVRDRVAELRLHCDAGQCRSPAVAAAIAKALTGDDAEFFRRYRPNRRVYRLLLEAWHARAGS